VAESSSKRIALADHTEYMSWRSRKLMLDLTVTAHERLCVVYPAMIVVEAVES
jgi:hypothetical protein